MALIYLKLILIFVHFVFNSNCQPLLFPHGWFESKNLRPRDAIYLNLMAQSSLEYGGTTLEDLDKLEAARKQIPRPENLPRDRVEDDKELDREPIDFSSKNKDKPKPKDEVARLPKSAPFQRIDLKAKKKRETSNSDETEKHMEKSSKKGGNPFEEIATRSPPKDYRSLKKLRHRHRKNRRIRNRYKKNGFLTRNDIIKSKPNDEPPSVTISDRKKEKSEFEQRNIAQETWERENKMAEQIRDEMKNNEGKEIKKEPEPISPALKLLDAENEELDRRIATIKQLDNSNMKRLPNNPFRHVDIRKPKIITLPIPPSDITNISRN